MSDATVTYGARLRRLRERQRLTQHQLAILAGLTPATISRLEHDHHTATDDTRRRLARALRVPAKEMSR